MTMRSIGKYALYALLYLVFFCLQAVLPPVSGASPELLPVLVGCTAVFEGVIPAALLGLWAGILRDTLSFSGLYYSLLYYFCAAGAAKLVRAYLRPGLSVSLLASLSICALSDAVPWLCFLLPFLGDEALPALTVPGVHLLFCLLFFFPLYPLCRAVHALAPRAGQKRESIGYRYIRSLRGERRKDEKA